MNTYLIYGNDYGLIKREIDKITNGIIDVVKYDLSASNVSEVIEEASCMSLFGDKKAVIGENALFLTGTNTRVNHDIDYLTSYVNAENHDNIVILTVVQDKLDERKKIVKLLKKNVTVIHKETIDEKDLPKFVIKEFLNNGYKIDYKTASYFVDYVGKNVDILLSEINKMIIYKDIDKEYGTNLCAIGKATKKFDFVFKSPSNNELIVMEVNFYGTQGSKPNETAKSYVELNNEINKLNGVKFVWITDGNGWNKSRLNLEDAYDKIEHLYTIKDLELGVLEKI